MRAAAPIVSCSTAVVIPLTGSQPSHWAKTKSRISPSQKLGIEWNVSVAPPSAASAQEPGRRAWSAAIAIPAAKASSSDVSASSAVRGSRSRTSAPTGRRIMNDSPRLPRIALAT